MAANSTTSVGLVVFNGIAGAAIGAFVALLIALSHSPVVASSLSVLLAAAVLFLALNDKVPSSRPKEMSPDTLARIVGFGGAAIVALLVGLDLRANNRFGESEVATEYRDLVKIGVPAADARAAVLRAMSARPAASASDKERMVKTFSLFSAQATAAACDEMEPSRFKEDLGLRAKYKGEAGPWAQALASYDRAASDVPKTDLHVFLAGYHSAMCSQHQR